MSNFKNCGLGLCFSFLALQLVAVKADEQTIKAEKSTTPENTFPIKKQQPMSLDKLYGGLKLNGSLKAPKGYVAQPKNHSGPCSTGCTHRAYKKIRH